MWQASLLLANADKPLPPAAVDLVRGDATPAAMPTAMTGPARAATAPSTPTAK